MLTKKDLEEVKNLIDEAVGQIIKAVGKALEEFATKEDLKSLATKEDLKSLATKVELKEIDGRLDRVETNITDIKRDVQDIKADMPTKEDFKNLKKLEEIHRKELSTYA